MEINHFKNKIICITGGTGSFGSLFVKKLLKKNPKEIRVFSRDEKKQEDLRIELGNEKLKFIIGDIRDFDSVKEATQNVDFIFHAAALKQVPSCEFYPMQAVKTNILGTENIVKSSIVNFVKKTIFLSTDKAVYPINAMGMTKALMEKIVLSQIRYTNKNQIFAITRYGNVIGSRGSVIPLFIDQLSNGKNITLTDPSMTRFLMSLDDAIELVMYAFENAENGDIFVHKAPSASLENLLKAISEILKIKPKIQIIGTRHGEKHYETLVSKEEMLRAIDKDNYFRIPSDLRDLNYNQFFYDGDINKDKYVEFNSNTGSLKSTEDIKKILLMNDIFGEYR